MSHVKQTQADACSSFGSEQTGPSLLQNGLRASLEQAKSLSNLWDLSSICHTGIKLFNVSSKRPKIHASRAKMHASRIYQEVISLFAPLDRGCSKSLAAWVSLSLALSVLSSQQEGVATVGRVAPGAVSHIRCRSKLGLGVR